MRFAKWMWLAPMLMLLTLGTANAQFKDIGMELGLYGGVTMDQTDTSGHKPEMLVRECVAFPVLDPLQVEVGIAYNELRAKSYRAVLMPMDVLARFCPAHTECVIPYAFAGIGALYYNTMKSPPNADPGASLSAWTGVVPAGVGVQYKLTDQVSLDLRGAYNLALNDHVNPIKKDGNDSYLTIALGLRVGRGTGPLDPDHDGLSNKEEKKLGTNPKLADTDGDGLSDGDEVLTYKTDPLKPDTDGDGLSDGDEVLKYKTDPLKADTDGDGLSDGDEVLKYKTDPLKTDTDGDGLSDAQEVQQYKTDALKVDSDGDELTDGDEVLKYKTDPLKMDTDGGTVNDGVEVKRGTNPLVASDDVPKIPLEMGKSLILEGIVFKTNSAEIMPESEKILNEVVDGLKGNPDVSVEIQGHTDNTGSKAHNMRLSQARADAVKKWLVAKAIDEKRMTTKGFGPDKPVAPNDTPENKQKNRRIEFVRTK
jgi:outer membrane protein OmpA-like peptidoglycan-associated protein